eukprot:TRINITY_DN6603_c0_g1_i16.p1 TRINITY_DN6603_c0_g1~~TRINITY_DN6603_c0_g1_i16.p1  ORF type:complete len:170 (+),score=17.40 TRINITY_DN6603_c0_g1_i16:110-619(+)
MEMILLFFLCGIAYGNDLHSKITAFNNTDIKSLDPTEKPVLAMFFNAHCEHCTEFEPLFGDVVSYCLGHWPNVGFYSINGPGNPDLIYSLKDLTVYPSFAYIAPLSTTLTEVYAGELNAEDVKGWAKTVLNRHYNITVDETPIEGANITVKDDSGEAAVENYTNCRVEL